MNPLMFKYRELVSRRYTETAPLPKIYAYQVFPKGDYSNHWKERGEEDFMITGYGYLNNHFCYNETKGYYELIFSKRNPLEPFFVGKNDWVTFRNCVTEYNRKYCEQPDSRVLDGFVEWCIQEEKAAAENKRTMFEDKLLSAYQEYKQTLETEYFEEIIND